MTPLKTKRGAEPASASRNLRTVRIPARFKSRVQAQKANKLVVRSETVSNASTSNDPPAQAPAQAKSESPESLEQQVETKVAVVPAKSGDTSFVAKSKGQTKTKPKGGPLLRSSHSEVRRAGPAKSKGIKGTKAPKGPKGNKTPECLPCQKNKKARLVKYKLH